MKLRVSVFFVCIGTTACATVRPLAAPANFVSQRNPELVWVHAHDGEILPVRRPSLRGDTLVGIHHGTSESVHVVLPHVRAISARQPDHTRTALLVATAGALAGFIIYRATQSSGPKASCYFDGHDWTCL